MQETFTTSSPARTLKLGEELASRFGVGDCIALLGDLGAGKTVLVRGLARGLGVLDEKMVSSPTYVLVQEYPAARARIYHIDLYRLPNPAAELGELGLHEMLQDGVVLIEWANRAAGQLPCPRWEILIEATGPRSRRFTLRKIEA